MPPPPSRIAEDLPILPIGDSDVPGVSRIIALANNENVEAPSAAVQAACAASSASSNWYPDVSATHLRSALAAVYPHIDAAHMVVGVGAGELIFLLTQAFCNPGDETIMGEHGYLYFGIATQAVGATPIRAGASGGGNHLGFDVDAVLDAVTPRTRIVFLDNPSNPLGTYLDSATLHRLRASLRDDVLLALDCAYGEYANAADFSCGDELVSASDNTVVLRTFSKVYGLAGLRIGWAHAPAAVAQTLLRVQRPGNVSRISLDAATAALSEPELIADRIARNTQTREWFTSVVSEQLGLGVIPSQTNFVLVTVPNGGPLSATDLFEGLRTRGVLVRPMGPYALPNSLRISIGTREQMEIVVEAMRDTLSA